MLEESRRIFVSFKRRAIAYDELAETAKQQSSVEDVQNGYRVYMRTVGRQYLRLSEVAMEEFLKIQGDVSKIPKDLLVDSTSS